MTRAYRRIFVNQDWLEKLERYLQADERFAESMDSFNLVLLTPKGKKLIFSEKGVVLACPHLKE